MILSTNVLGHYILSIIIDVQSESHVQIEVKLNANVTKKQE